MKNSKCLAAEIVNRQMIQAMGDVIITVFKWRMNVQYHIFYYAANDPG